MARQSAFDLKDENWRFQVSVEFKKYGNTKFRPVEEFIIDTLALENSVQSQIFFPVT